MSIQTTLRPLAIASVALVAVLAAGCQSTMRTSSVDRSTTMGASGPAHATTGPGTIHPSGTNGGTNASGTSAAAPGTGGSGATGAGGGSTGAGGAGGTGGAGGAGGAAGAGGAH